MWDISGNDDVIVAKLSYLRDAEFEIYETRGFKGAHGVCVGKGRNGGRGFNPVSVLGVHECFAGVGTYFVLVL